LYPHETGKANKICLNETYSTGQVGKHLSDMFPIKNVFKQGDRLISLLFNSASEYAIRRAQVNRVVLKLNGTHQLLVFAENITILGRSIHSIKKTSGGLVVAGKETGLEVNADKTKYMVKSQDWTAG